MNRRPWLTTPLALTALLAVAAVAWAGRPDLKPTTITVDGASVTPEGAVDVIGSVSSPARICRNFRTVELLLKRPGVRPRHLDVGTASFQSQVWRLKSRPGVADDEGRFFVTVERQRIRIISVDQQGDPKKRRTIVCAGDRAPVELGPPE